MSDLKEFYRYEAVQYGSVDEFDGPVQQLYPNPTVELRTFDLLKETPKGYWVGWKHIPQHKKWVSKTATKRFAYPTKEAALLNYIKRTERRIEILKYQIQASEAALTSARHMQNAVA